jgi:hypothetical protein
MRKLITTLTIFLLASAITVNAQPGGAAGGKGDAKKAKLYFEFDRNYKDALTEYLKLLKDEPNDPEINYRIGLCYLYTNIDKKKAYKYLEIMARQPKAPDEVYLELGRAYHIINRFDDAIKKYSEFIEIARLRPAELAKVNRYIEQCRIGKALTTSPVDVTFECLGKEVNSPFDDMFPFITADESYMTFTSRRNTVTGGFKDLDGTYASDIFSSLQTAGKWGKPKNLSSIVNTGYFEVGTSMAPDATNVICYFSNETAQADLYIISKKDKAKSFSKAVSLGAGVNMPKSLEMAGVISPDGSTLIFSSDRPGGKGGFDLYKSTNEGGEWSAPVNLGAPINTDGDEDYPNFSPDGKKLFFASNSAKSMGGFDIFSATYNKATEGYDEPVNLGYPINNTDDNQTISFNQTGTVAYVSASREGGIGELDIWKITFKTPMVDVQKTKFKGIVSPVDKEFTITVTDKFTGKEVAKTTPEKGTGKYSISLAPGRYIFKTEADGFITITEEVPVLGKATFKENVTKDITMVEGVNPPPPPAGTKPGTPVKPK